MMKAARFSQFGGPEVLEIVDLPAPHPGPGGVGDGTTTDRLTPTLVPSLATVSLHEAHACARKTNGTVWCWGYDTHGELGAGTISAQFCYEATNRCRPAPGPVMLACP